MAVFKVSQSIFHCYHFHKEDRKQFFCFFLPRLTHIPQSIAITVSFILKEILLISLTVQNTFSTLCWSWFCVQLCRVWRTYKQESLRLWIMLDLLVRKWDFGNEPQASLYCRLPSPALLFLFFPLPFNIILCAFLFFFFYLRWHQNDSQQKHFSCALSGILIGLMY